LRTSNREGTAESLAFHRRVSAALREVALAEAELSDTSETLRGTLRIAGSAVFVAGKGIAVIPFYHVREAVEAGRAKIVLDDFKKVVI
jgi:hypothetical protein